MFEGESLIASLTFLGPCGSIPQILTPMEIRFAKGDR